METKKMTEMQRKEKVRESVLETLNIPEGAVHIGPGEYAIETEFGPAKIKVTGAAKDFDIEEAGANWAFVLQEREVKAAQLAEKKAAKVKNKNKDKD